VIERRLGAGSMGVVYRARDTALERDVAIKTLPEVSEAAVARLRWEARAMAALDSPGLATIYGLEVWRRTPALIVEYLPGGTLADRLRSPPALPEREVVRLGLDLARALSVIHGRGLLHRDIKPSNIGLTAAGTPKLLDFGLAVFRAPARDAGHRGNAAAVAPLAADRPAGTPAYMPPEALAGAPASPSSDLWALSVVLYEALTGARPRPPRHDLTPPSRAWLAFFERALADDPEQRCADAASFIVALEEVQLATE
jgi:serine/threonine protein kinase